MVAERFGVYLVRLDPAAGAEIKKTRPCLVIAPDEMNRNIRTTIVAPMTTTRRRYPTRVACRFAGKEGDVALDQIRAIDQSRLLRCLGSLDPPTASRVLRVLAEMLAP